MAFFPGKIYNNSEASYKPLFRLLEDFDKHYSHNGGRRNVAPQWQPKFDVRETEQTFELYGEIPGVQRENVDIKFTDPQTMLIHGKSERSYTSAPTPASPVETSTVNNAVDDSDKHSNSSYQATVEDDFEDLSENAPQQSPKEPEKAVTKEVEKTQTVESKPTPKAKYWLTERSIGEFSRSFHFPTRVEQEGTTASFKDGILTVVVPKAKRHETRRIIIF